MNIATQLQKLKSSNQNEADEALSQLNDHFYFDQAMTNEDFLLVVKTLIEMIINQHHSLFETDLLALLESNLYSNGEKVVEPDVFKTAIQSIANTKSKVFFELLKPFKNSPAFEEELKAHFDIVERN